MDFRTLNPSARGLLAPTLALAALVVGCTGGEDSNAAPQSAVASPRSEINANPSPAKTADSKDLVKSAPEPSAKADTPKAGEVDKDAGSRPHDKP